MFRLFPRKTAQDATTVSLRPAPGAPQPSAQIEHPEMLSPVPQPVLAFDPHEDADRLRELVVAKVAGLAAAAALDQDNLNALSQQILAWRATWEDRQRQVAESRRKVAGLLVSQIGENLAVSRARLSALRTRRDDLVDMRERMLRELGFEPVVAPPGALENLLSDEESVLDGHLPPVAGPAVGDEGTRDGSARRHDIDTEGEGR